MSPLIRSILSFITIFIVPLLIPKAVGVGNERLVDNSLEGRELKALLSIESGIYSRGGDPIGFHFELLNRFAEEHNCTVTIISPKDDDHFSQLVESEVDLILKVGEEISLPPLHREKVISGKKFNDNSIIWVKQGEGYPLIASLNYWLSHYNDSDEYQKLRARYSFSYRRFNRPSSPISSLSPYDNIIKKYASELDWDWRLLASLIYQESKFRIAVKSHRNAYGLMQLLPSTAKAHGVENPLNPEENIRGGTLFLKRLKGLYNSPKIDSLDRVKLTLAAYNAGEGRIADLMRVAKHKGVNHLEWDRLVEMIPYTTENGGDTLPYSIVKHGPFKGVETIKYVDEVMERYENYKNWVKK